MRSIALPNSFKNLDKSTKKSAITLSRKREALIGIVESVLDHPRHRSGILRLMLKLGIGIEQLIQGFIEYNLDVFSHGNEIYDSVVNRLVLHIHNLVANSWHQDRQRIAFDFIKKAKPSTIADIGFGEPSLYMRELLKSKKTQISLFDYSDTAFSFARVLFDCWDENWTQAVSFSKMDMETGEYVGDYDLYIFQDSIEHITQPEAYLKKYVKLAPSHSHFLLSIPVGPLIPCHYMAWSSVEEVDEWVASCGLNIIAKEIVWTQPGVDIFAETLSYEMHGVYLLCEKMVN